MSGPVLLCVQRQDGSPPLTLDQPVLFGAGVLPLHLLFARVVAVLLYLGQGLIGRDLFTYLGHSDLSLGVRRLLVYLFGRGT